MPSLRLKDGVYQVRSEIGELEEFNWTDYQIINDLNFSAQAMCSAAGTLTKYQSVQLLQAVDQTTQIGVQEAALDIEIDKVKGCKYFSGQLFDLEPHDWQSLQVGASTGSIPRWYYLKTSTRELTPQSTGTSNIVDIPLSPMMPGGDVFRTVIGVWPIPPEPANISLWYSYYHPYMQDPTDPCEIPPKFIKGWVAGAIARCLRIEKAHAEAQMYEQIHEAEMEKYRIYAGSQRQVQKPPRYGMVIEPWRQNASSSVILVDPFPMGP
jgi:hypothetical protein